MGLRVNGSHLYVLDAKFGLFRIPLAKSYVKDHLLKPDIEIYQSNRTVFFNSFVFDPIHSHLVYLSITSLRYNVDRVPYSLFEHEATGQVVALDLRSGKVTKIASGLHFANGIEVSSDAKWLFVSETTAFRLRRIELKRVHEHLFVVSATGNEELELQTFGAQLPGEPDNIVAFKGKLLVGFALARSDGKWIVSDYLASWPSLRRGLLRILYAVSVPLEYLVTLLDTLKLPAFSMIRHEANKYSFDFWSGYVIYNLAPNKGAFAVIDQETGAIETLYALPDTSFVSEAAIVPGTDTILVGSFRNPFIGVLKGLKI